MPTYTSLAPQSLADDLRLNRAILARLAKGVCMLGLSALLWAGIYAMVPA